MATTPDFSNIITAMITPFKADKQQSVDFNSLISVANHLLQNGTDTLLLTGSTGEAAQLSLKERKDILKCVRKNTPAKTKIIVSTGDTNTKRAIDRTKTAFDLGADGVLVAVPEYIKPPQKALIIHFTQIAKAVADRPVIIYNIPSRTGTEIMPDTVAQLAKKNPNIIGIKQSFGNLDRVSEMRNLCPPTFQIYSGDDSLTLPMLALGAKGVVSVASHVAGPFIQQMIKDFKAGKTEKAAAYHQFLFPLYKSLSVTTNPIPVKEALYQEGLIASPKLRTLGGISQKDKKLITRALSQLNWQEKFYHSR